MPILNDCCCGFSLKKGTIAIGVVWLLWGLFWIGLTEFEIPTKPEQSVQYGDICSWIILATLGIYLIVVASQENAVLVFSWIFVEILRLINLICLMPFVFYRKLLEEVEFVALMIVFFILFVLIVVYFLLVVYSYYQSLRDKQGDSRT